MLPFKLIYHDRYDLNLGAHVFPSKKFRLIAEYLLRERVAGPEDFLTPEPASDEDVLRIHTIDWVRKLKTGSLTPLDVMKLEIPYSLETVSAAASPSAAASAWMSSSRPISCQLCSPSRARYQ